MKMPRTRTVEKVGKSSGMKKQVSANNQKASTAGGGTGRKVLDGNKKSAPATARGISQTPPAFTNNGKGLGNRF